jgi:hypothetical protein
MIDPPTQSMAAVPTSVSPFRKPGIPFTTARPTARVSPSRPCVAMASPASSAFTISATAP